MADHPGPARAPENPPALEAENAQLRDALQRHRRLLTGISEIQHAIAQRVPLQTVLDCVVQVAEDVLGDPQIALFLRDPADDQMLVLAAHRGWEPGLETAIARRPVKTGVAGQAVREGRLVVAQPYAAYDGAMPEFVRRGLEASMAAPVTEDGRTIGSLLISSYRPGRRYTGAEREALVLFAEHASLALNDARTVAKITDLPVHDPLTALPTPALCLDRLQHALDRAARGDDAPPAVLFCDVDDFKTVNDSLGHTAGDELLRIAADRLRRCLRPGDTPARLGGDEFAVLLEHVEDREDAILVADRILKSLRSPIVVHGHEIFASASIGIALHHDSGGDLLRAADVAMYNAKAAGRGCHALYRPSMQADAVARLKLGADLQRALDRHELEVYYQPLVQLDGSRVVGFEALVRWNHPERGLIFPGEFIALAEETGLICHLDRFVLREACAQLARWRRAHPGGSLDTVSVNISARQLATRGLTAEVLDALGAAGLGPEHLMLELTETTLMHDLALATAAMDALKALGVRLAIDDFGTGYSSLRYLSMFPLDALKMAKPFVDGLAAGVGDGRLAATIADLARNLGLGVIAEGIEEPAQLCRLQELGCGHGQGYLFAPAMRVCEIDAVLAAAPADGLWRPETAPATTVVVGTAVGA